MTFSEVLNDYMTRLELSGAALAKASGLSAGALSRYRTGARTPEYNSEPLKKLARGISLAAGEKGTPLEEAEIRAALNGTVQTGLRVEHEIYLSNLNALLGALDVRSVSLAKALSFDPSYISKVLSGGRRPGNPSDFSFAVADYIARSYTEPRSLSALSKLMDVHLPASAGPAAVRDAIVEWLGSNHTRETADPIDRFLQNVDSFDLNVFIRSIHFDEIKLPTLPFQLPTVKTYEGTAEMMESELDFIKATVLSRSMEDCILYSDMPIEEMASDPEFPKKWMMGMAMLLKKGLHLHIIHDVHRPFAEMMLGLEGNIPMYMTGQISPYYLPAAEGNVFSHLLKVSGAAALEGSAIAGCQPEGRYVLTKNREDLRFYRKKAQRLLDRAQPLMEIYRSDRAYAYAAFLRGLPPGEERRVVAGSLPVFTMPESLLDTLLERCGITSADADRIRRYRRDTAEAVGALPENSKIFLTVPLLTEAQFNAAPLHLQLSELFFEADVPYTYEVYAAHLEETRAFCRAHPNLVLETDPVPAFRNISYTVVGNRLVIVSKNKSPAIHFVIHHKKMVQAFSRFHPPIREEKSD